MAWIDDKIRQTTHFLNMKGDELEKARKENPSFNEFEKLLRDFDELEKQLKDYKVRRGD